MTMRHSNGDLRARFRASSVGDEPPSSDFPAKMPEPRHQESRPLRGGCPTSRPLCTTQHHTTAHWRSNSCATSATFPWYRSSSASISAFSGRARGGRRGVRARDDCRVGHCRTGRDPSPEGRSTVRSGHASARGSESHPFQGVSLPVLSTRAVATQLRAMSPGA
jgi:hypothetical protein